MTGQVPGAPLRLGSSRAGRRDAGLRVLGCLLAGTALIITGCSRRVRAVSLSWFAAVDHGHRDQTHIVLGAPPCGVRFADDTDTCPRPRPRTRSCCWGPDRAGSCSERRRTVTSARCCRSPSASRRSGITSPFSTGVPIMRRTCPVQREH